MKKIEYLSNLIKNKKQEPAEMAYGYFLLAENERKKFFLRNRLFRKSK